MVVTGLVYAVLLAPASADVGLTEPWVDAVVHEVAPVLVLLDWLVDPPGRRLSVRAGRARWLIFPAVYLVYSLVRGPIADWYPYPFLDPDHGERRLRQRRAHLGRRARHDGRPRSSPPASGRALDGWRRLSPWTPTPSRSGCSAA